MDRVLRKTQTPAESVSGLWSVSIFDPGDRQEVSSAMLCFMHLELSDKTSTESYTMRAPAETEQKIILLVFLL